MSSLFPQNIDRLPSPGFLPRDEDLVELLRSQDFDTRLQTLNRAMSLTRRDPEWFNRFQKKGELFKCIDRILAEDRWEVQHQCVRFLTEAMTTLGTSLEYCMCYLLPNIVPKLGSSKITVRRVSIQLIQTYLKMHPEALGSVLKILSTFLLTSSDRLMKAEVVVEVAALFIPEVHHGNWSILLDCLTKWMSSAESDTVNKIALTSKKLEVYVGKDIFARMLGELPEQQQKDYAKHSKNVTVDEPVAASSSLLSRLSGKNSERRFRFGIVPIFISAMITDEDSGQRIAGLEKLKQIVEKISPEDISRLVPHLHSYLMSIGHLLNDLNFKVVVLSLDVLRLTVNRLKTHIDAHMQQVISLLSKHFGNQKAVMKQLLMMTCMDLFQNLNPKTVMGTLAVYLENRNSRTREEVVNIMISAMMVISASKFNFSAVINMLVPLLIDPKRRVRLAAFELLSVVSYLMSGKTDSLMRAVRDAEERHQVAGLAAAVQARIRRQLLPRIRYDGLIDYSTPPNNDASFDVNDSDLSSTDNLDLKWILHAGSDGNDRSISPVTLLRQLGVPVPRIEKQWDEKSQEDAVSIHSLPNMERMKSEELLRKSDTSRMGSAVSNSRSQSATTRRTIRVQPLNTTSTSLDGLLRKNTTAISNPSSSTNSWHAPRRNNSITTQEDRSSSAIVNRNKAECKLDASLDKVRMNADFKKSEMNNNTVIKPIPAKRNKVAAAAVSLSKARSEGNLVEESENRPPMQINHDDAPIRPAKNGQYLNEYASNGVFASQVKKSTSHHSLPVTGHAPLKSVVSNPSKKPHAFLKSGTNNRSKVSNVVSRENSTLSKSSRPKAVSSDIGGASVQTALRLISSEEWNDKVDGLTMINDLSTTNPKQINDNLPAVFAAVVSECKNLRSSVSRVALSCLGTLFENMKGKADGEIDKACNILMQKAGDVSNAFIREDASEALDKVVKNASASKTLHSLVTAGSKSKNNTIRTSCAQFVHMLVHRIGISNILNSSEHINRLIPQLIAFSKDQYPNVRQQGRQTLIDLSGDSSFDRMLRKNINESEYKTVKEILGQIEKKGGLDAFDSTSISLGSSLSRNGSVKKAVPRKLENGIQLDLDECRNELNSAGWEKRLSGLRRFEEMSNATPKIVASDTRLIEAFISRLSDINSKVSLEALDSYLMTLPVMSRFYSSESHLKAVLNQLVLALMSHLSSKSEEHRHLAQTALRETVKQIDGASLASAVAAATKKANVKQKPFMLSVFNSLNRSLYPSRPKQVELCALPILWDTIRGGMADSETRRATTEYANGLAKLMGERALLEQATMELDPPRRKLLESLLR